MEDLLGAYPTIAAWLANLAVDARFELARYRAQSEKYTELAAVERFLKSVAAARIKYPQRMKNVDEKFNRLRQKDLLDLEEELFQILSFPSSGHANLNEVTRLGQQLHAAAGALFIIDRQYSDERRKHEDEHGV